MDGWIWVRYILVTVYTLGMNIDDVGGVGMTVSDVGIASSYSSI